MTGNQLRSTVTKPAGRATGEYLRSLRLARGMTLEQAGEQVGMSATQLSRIEMNIVRMPEPRDLRRLTDLYGVSPIDVLIAAGYIDRA